MPSLTQLFVLAAPFMGLIQQVAANPEIDESNDLIARDDFESDLYARGAGNGVIKRPNPIVVIPHQRKGRSLNRRGAGNGVVKRPNPIVVIPHQRKGRSLNRRGAGNGVVKRPNPIVVIPHQRKGRSLNRRGAGGGVIKRPGPNPRPVPPIVTVTPPQRRPGRH